MVFIRFSGRVAFALLLLVSTAGAQVVFTESFEVPDTTDFLTFSPPSQIVTATNVWDVTGGSIDVYEDAARTEAVAFDGAQAIDMAGSPGAGQLETSFPTTPGATYRLTFRYARNALLGLEPGDAEVDVLGGSSLLSTTIQHDPAELSFDAHVLFSEPFVADGVQATLRFTSLDSGNHGITIDAITVAREQAVPLIGGPFLFLLVGGLVLIGTLRARHA